MASLGRTLAERARSLKGRFGPRGLLAGGAVAAVALVVVLVAVIPGGGGEAPPPADAPDSTDPGSGASKPAGGAGPVARAMRRMSVGDKVGQLMLVGPGGTDAGGPVISALEQRGYGGLVIESSDYASPGQVSRLADEAAGRARRSEHVAPWVMAPQDGGEASALDGLPPDEAPDEIGSPRDAGDEGEKAAEQLLDAGVNGVLSPLLDVAPFGGSSPEQNAYSDDADEVSAYAAATVRAFGKADVFAAPKHFPGLGAASGESEEGPVNVGLGVAELARRDLRPFEEAIRADVPGIVVGHGIYQAGDFVTPASLSPAIVEDLLRDRLGFEGVAITDDLTSPAVTATLPSPEAAVEAVKAGEDLVWVSRDEKTQTAVYDALLRAVKGGKIEAARLDEAVTRTLEAKRTAGLLEGSGGGGGKEKSGDGGGR